MKKYLLSFCATLLAFAVKAGTTPGLEYAWGKLIDGSTSAGDQSTDISVDKNGNVYWFGTFGSTEAAPDIYFGEEYLYSGAPYNAGNSQNNNFTLIKTDKDGNLLWNVHSIYGDFSSNAGGCAATSDGGVIVVSKVRHTDGMTDKKVSFVDASNTVTELDWEPAVSDKRNYVILVSKISADGKISWLRRIDFSTEPGPGASGNYSEFWADVFNLKSIALDSNENIYIALNFRNPVSVPKADGSSETIVPSESDALKSWKGDSQSAVGDFLLLGLNADGYYRNRLTFEGSAKCTICDALEFADGKIYAEGYALGDGNVIKAGDFTMAPTSDGAYNPLVLCMSPDFKVCWAKCFKGEKVDGKNGFQNVGLTVCMGNLWLCGQYSLRISDPDDSSKSVGATQGKIREGFIIKLDAATGEWIAARNSRDDNWNEPSDIAKTGLTGYFRVLQNPEKPEKIYVFGYVMNVAVGAFLRQYDALTLEGNLAEGQNNIVTQGGVPSVQCIAYDPANAAAYFTVRGNNKFLGMGGSETAKPKAWAILAAKCKLPADMISTGIEGIVADENAPVEYYNLQGIRVANPENGLYIRRQGNKTGKVLINRVGGKH